MTGETSQGEIEIVDLQVEQHVETTEQLPAAMPAAAKAAGQEAVSRYVEYETWKPIREKPKGSREPHVRFGKPSKLKRSRF